MEKRPAPSFDAKASRRVHRCVAEWLTLLRKLDSSEMRIIADSSFDIPRMLGCSFGSVDLRAQTSCLGFVHLRPFMMEQI